MIIKELQENIFKSGVVRWIGLRPDRRVAVQSVDAVQVEQGGLKGDRYKNTNGSRHVTLIQSEHLKAVASYLNVEKIEPALVRRNILTEGINLLALKGKKFSIGNAVFEFSGECHPCSRMEEVLSFGGYNAMRGHGGITARILETGIIAVGDKIQVIN